MSTSILHNAIDRGLFDESPWAVFVDLDRLETRFDRLRVAFDDDTLHAVAVKANPLVKVLRRLAEKGAGLEVASQGELQVARRTPAPASSIVFDSPAKTCRELTGAIAEGIRVNADSLAELARIDELDVEPSGNIGLRLNPVVGAGGIEATSVATTLSKFGVDLKRHRRELVAAFEQYPWLDGLHVHTGSQGCGLSLLVEGVRRCVDFAVELEQRYGPGCIRTIDIGGGLPVAYRPDDEAPEIEEYAQTLRDEVPALFDGPWRIVTEFGRWLFAPCGFAASRVEYVKPTQSGVIATIHFGADLLVRTAYRPNDWYHRVTIHDKEGLIRRGEQTTVTVAGPLCFSGDLVARQRALPHPVPGDFIAAHDVGAYTFSMWSRYCSRPFPPVFGVIQSADGAVEFTSLHPGETTDEVAAFWDDSPQN